jgi:ketosteroid isomerase-like protein
MENAMTATEQANVRLVREHFAAESMHDYAATLDTLADEIEYRMIPNGLITCTARQRSRATTTRGGAPFRTSRSTCSACPPPASGVIAECVSTATHQGEFMGVPPTGKRVTAHVCTLIRMRAGKMVEETVSYDLLERLAQIGSVLELDGHRVALP